jgi:hypothetical protein
MTLISSPSTVPAKSNVLAKSSAANPEAKDIVLMVGIIRPAVGDTGLDFVHFNGMSGHFCFPKIMPPGAGYSTANLLSISSLSSSLSGLTCTNASSTSRER